MKAWRRPTIDEDPAAWSRTPRDMLMIFGPALLIAVVGFVVAFQFVRPLPPRRIVMATGPENGGYHWFGLRYREILARDGIELELRTTAGTFENVRLLEEPNGEVEVAFLQGGAGADEEIPGVLSLGSVFYEPVWIFWRDHPPDTVQAFLGNRVAIGEPGSGTRSAITRLFELNGIPLAQATAVEIGGDAAVQSLIDGEVDAACFVATHQAQYVRRLLKTSNLQLMPFVRADAYVRRFRFLSRVVLPRGVTDLENDLPPVDVPLIAMVANIAARDTLHPALVGQLLQAAEEVHGGGDVIAPPGRFPSTYNVVLPMNQEARRYLKKGPPLLRRYLPFWIAIGIDRLVVLLIPFLTLLYPLFKIVPPTYRWRVRSRIYRHYRDLIGVEARLHDNPLPEVLAKCRTRLDAIDDELAHLSVPAAHAEVLYHLRLHLRFERERLEEAVRAAAERTDGEIPTD